MFHHGTYTGTGGITGENYPTSYTLPWKPDLVIVIGESSLAILPYGVDRSINRYGENTISLTVSWSGNTVSWHTNSSTDNTYVQLNQKGTTYHVFAFAALS